MLETPDFRSIFNEPINPQKIISDISLFILQILQMEFLYSIIMDHLRKGSMLKAGKVLL